MKLEKGNAYLEPAAHMEPAMVREPNACDSFAKRLGLSSCQWSTVIDAVGVV